MDVLHSFFLPNMRMKQDAVPGMKIPVWFRAIETGTYDLVCAELVRLGALQDEGPLDRRVARRLRQVAGAKIRRAGKTTAPNNTIHFFFILTFPHPFGGQGRGVFFFTYVFSRDHKIIGMQFLFTTLLWFLVGGLLALGVRWQLAWPWSPMPVIGKMLFSGRRRARSRPSSTRCCSRCTPR